MSTPMLCSVPPKATEIAGILGQLDPARPLVIRYNSFTRAQLRWFAREWERIGGVTPIVMVRDETDIMHLEIPPATEIRKIILDNVASGGTAHWAMRAAEALAHRFVLLRRPALDEAERGLTDVRDGS